MGKSIRAGTDTAWYTVTGIMADMPSNSHFHLNAIGSFSSNPRSRQTSWTSNSFYTYLLLDQNANLDELDRKIVETVNMNIGPELEEFLGISIDEFTSAGNAYGYKLQPLTGIHLDSSVQHDLKPGGEMMYIYVFSMVGLIILVMAGINYTNLATARSAGRSRGVDSRLLLLHGVASVLLLQNQPLPLGICRVVASCFFYFNVDR